MSADFEVRQQPDRVATRKIIAVAVSAAVILAVSLFAAEYIAPGGATYGKPSAPPPVAPQELGIVEQTLFETTARGYALNAKQHQILEHYSWVDRQAGTVRIPIARAMDLYVEQAEKADKADQAGKAR